MRVFLRVEVIGAWEQPRQQQLLYLRCPGSQARGIFLLTKKYHLGAHAKNREQSFYWICLVTPPAH
jgi:hypothetical protein